MEKAPRRSDDLPTAPIDPRWDEIANASKPDVIYLPDTHSALDTIQLPDTHSPLEPIQLPDTHSSLDPIRLPDTHSSLDVIQLPDTESAAYKELELAKAKELELAKAREKELELQKDLENYQDIDKELLELDAAEYRDIDNELLELESQSASDRPLVAVTADWSHDRAEIAHDLAERALNAEVAKGNIIDKIWKGTLFKKYYEKRYQKEFLNNKRRSEDGLTLREIIKQESPDVIERFVLSAVENEERYRHGDEKLEKLDEKTNEEIKHAIEKYARTKIDKGMKVSDLNRIFLNDVGRIMEESIKKGHISSNYLDVAKEAARRYEEVSINAKTKAEQDKALAEVMAGFQAYHAEVRNGVRTEAHRDNIDKIVNAFESSKFGQFIPAEIVAGAAGAAMALTQTGARAVFGVVGGIGVSSIMTGLKERNRLTEDRARMLRDIASGKKYNSENEKIANHEKRIGGTLYDMRSASELTDRLNAAMYPEDGQVNEDDVLRAIAEARVRIDFSDSEHKDLISYSSDRSRGKERLDLDIALIKAEKSLGDKYQKTLEIMKEGIAEDIFEDVEAKDKEFKNYRTLAAMKKAGKSLLLGSAIFLGSQEIMAAFDPDKIGIFEKAGLLKTENANEAKETLIAKAFGAVTGKRGTYEIPGTPITDTVENVSDYDAIKDFEANGYKKVMVKDQWYKPESIPESVDPSASTARIDVKYDSWAQNGGLRTKLENGEFTSTIRGAAIVNGRSVNYSPDQIKGFITVGDAKFEIRPRISDSGEFIWSSDGVFTTTTGETIKAIGDNGEKLYKYFEVAAENSIEDGIHHITPLATDIGSNNFSDKITQIVEKSVRQPAVYNLVKQIPGTPETVSRGLDLNGFAFAPELARTGLGEAVEVARPASEIIPEETTLESPVDFSDYTPDVMSASESESTPEQGFEEWENDILEDIESVRDLIGDEGVNAFTDSTPLNEEQQARWRNWWNNLSEEGKNAVRDLDDHIRNSDPSYFYSSDHKFGVPFQTWLVQNR